MKRPSDEQPKVYRFGEFEINVLQRKLVARDGNHERIVEITKIQFDLLLLLVVQAWTNPGEPIEAEELLKRLWPDDKHNIGTGKLRAHVTHLRKILKNQADGSAYIPQGLYFLAAPVEAISASPARPSEKLAAPSFLEGAGADPASPPYVGPQPFSPDRTHEFFGRNSESEELIQLVERRDGPKGGVILMYSPSGAGKTSLLNTTVRERLTERGYHVLPVARLGVVPGRPTQAQNLYTFAALSSMTNELELERVPTSWSECLSATVKTGTGKVVIIDQLEEMITTPLGPPHQKREFFLQLRDAVVANPSSRVLLACREEYLPELQRVAVDLVPYWTLFPLEMLRSVNAKLAITGPAAIQGVVFDEAVVDALVEELTRIRYVDALGHPYDETGEFVEPLQLQVVCHALWRRLSPGVKHVSLREINQVMPSGVQADAVLRPRDAITKFVDLVLRDFCGNAIHEVAAQDQKFPLELIDLGCQQFISRRGTRLSVH